METMPEQDEDLEKPNDRAGLTSSLALLCAIWFVLTAWFWTYFANLLLSYPVGLVGLLPQKLGRRGEWWRGACLRSRVRAGGSPASKDGVC